MPLSLALCICGAVVALVCICYGVISSLQIRKKEKAELKKEQMSKYLYLSTSWLMWSDIYGIKVSNITSSEKIKYGFRVLFSKKSSDKIDLLVTRWPISGILKGCFEKLPNGRYRFVNDSLFDAEHDIEKLMMYYSLSTALTTDYGVEVNDGR
jgi:hypothetical protein